MGPARVAPALLLLLVLAAAASIPRFGQRENEGASVSDSDYYLDMARVFSGQQPAFDSVWSAPGHPGAHHYARPLLPFAAGWLARAASPLGLRGAFSVLNVLGAWAVAALLFLLLAARAPELRRPWVPAALFLTGFPQVDWGYHILTDTAGYASALAAALAAWWALRWRARPGPISQGAGAWPDGSSTPLWVRLLVLAVLQALAFLTRETAWIVPVAVAWLWLRDRGAIDARVGVAVLGVSVLAVLPWLAYLRSTGVRPISIPLNPRGWLDPRYTVDFGVKSVAAFNLLWGLAALAGRPAARRALPPLFGAWTVGAVCYVAASYAHNSLAGIGYPLRLTWALFPAVLFLAAVGWERLSRGSRVAALLLVALNGAIGIGGTLLDPGTSGITVPALLGRK